jgi:5-methylthioribose kinase
MHDCCPAHVPRVYKFDRTMCMIAMQYLAPPHVVLRYGFLDGAVYPKLPHQAAEFLACSLFRSSLLKLDSREFWERAARFGNAEMCALTEQVRGATCPGDSNFFRACM